MCAREDRFCLDAVHTCPCSIPVETPKFAIVAINQAKQSTAAKGDALPPRVDMLYLREDSFADAYFTCMASIT
jgi:hypothetical protein